MEDLKSRSAKVFLKSAQAVNAICVRNSRTPKWIAALELINPQDMVSSGALGSGSRVESGIGDEIESILGQG